MDNKVIASVKGVTASIFANPVQDNNGIDYRIILNRINPKLTFKTLDKYKYSVGVLNKLFGADLILAKLINEKVKLCENEKKYNQITDGLKIKVQEANQKSNQLINEKSKLKKQLKEAKLKTISEALDYNSIDEVYDNINWIKSLMEKELSREKDQSNKKEKSSISFCKSDDFTF